MEDFDAEKLRKSGTPRYRLAHANVFVSPGGFHFIDHLDPVEEISPEIGLEPMTDDEVHYIETQLQYSRHRFEHQAQTTRRHATIAGARVLDIGCGGGLFLSLLKEEAKEIVGIELSDTRAQYAATRHGVGVVKRPIESEYWRGFECSFDVVTLWDVLEHVNYPLATLRAAARVLKPGGVLLIDTPCRDSFYHMAGATTYALSGGRFPTFLNQMYSAQRFGHKQIFSLAELRDIITFVGLEVRETRRFQELSLPYRSYLRRLLRSEKAAVALEPVAKVALQLFPIHNKMLAVGCKK